MKTTVISDNAVDARRQAEAKLNARQVHISAVFHNKLDPTKRDWVFSTAVLG